MTTARRFALTAFVASAVLLVVASGATLAVVSVVLQRQVDAPLQADVASVARELAERTATARDVCRRVRSTPISRTTVTIAGRDGHELCRSNLAEPALPASVLTSASTGPRTLTVGESTLRVVVRHGRGGVVAATAPADNVRTTGLLAAVLAGITIAGTLVAGLTASAVGRRATAQLDRLEHQVRGVVDEARMGSRVDAVGAPDLDDVGRRFNTLLDRIERLATTQRTLMADAAHQLRTPLTGARTNLQVLARLGDDAPERGQIVRDVVQQLAALAGMVDDAVELASVEERWGAGAWHGNVQLDEVVAAAVDAARERLPAHTVLCRTEPAIVVGDPELLGRALANLVDNAARFAPDDTPIEVVQRDGEVAVLDRGPGFDAAERAHVFQPFYRGRAARRHPGTGLGLALVARVAELHGGTVGVHDRAGGGSAVTLHLGHADVPAPRKLTDGPQAGHTSPTHGGGRDTPLPPPDREDRPMSHEPVTAPATPRRWYVPTSTHLPTGRIRIAAAAIATLVAAAFVAMVVIVNYVIDRDEAQASPYPTQPELPLLALATIALPVLAALILFVASLWSRDLRRVVAVIEAVILGCAVVTVAYTIATGGSGSGFTPTMLVAAGGFVALCAWSVRHLVDRRRSQSTRTRLAAIGAAAMVAGLTVVAGILFVEDRGGIYGPDPARELLQVPRAAAVSGFPIGYAATGAVPADEGVRGLVEGIVTAGGAGGTALFSGSGYGTKQTDAARGWLAAYVVERDGRLLAVVRGTPTLLPPGTRVALEDAPCFVDGSFQLGNASWRETWVQRPGGDSAASEHPLRLDPDRLTPGSRLRMVVRGAGSRLTCLDVLDPRLVVPMQRAGSRFVEDCVTPLDASDAELDSLTPASFPTSGCRRRARTLQRASYLVATAGAADAADRLIGRVRACLDNRGADVGPVQRAGDLRWLEVGHVLEEFGPGSGTCDQVQPDSTRVAFQSPSQPFGLVERGTWIPLGADPGMAGVSRR